ncbi:thiamine pyrophosphate enzyme [Xylariaceae sp. FL1019]|nr:thiamine pyrophosphate enzyme [Xylariaceae sp. FL1019]
MAYQQREVPGYTTSFAMFEALWEAGITTCFVNLGNDHPSIIEAIVKGKRERFDRWPRMITCPSEITAISMADGYARVTGKPQAVIVHVDVGTQALGQGIHNACVGRVPIFIFSGLCPSTESGELPGTRTEYAHWLQEPHDQKAIVRQYCRYVGEFRTGLNVKQTISRALQFANTSPKGPVYLVATREVLAEEIQPYSLKKEQWLPVSPSALPSDAVKQVAFALAHANQPLIITGYSGRDWRNPEALVALADCIPGIRIHDTGGSDMCFPATHIASEGFRLANHDCSANADVILVLDCDVPWIPAVNAPANDTRIYHIDNDPLNQQMPVSFFPAHGRWKADSFTSISQIINYIKNSEELSMLLQSAEYLARKAERAEVHSKARASISAQLQRNDADLLNAHSIGYLLRTLLTDCTFVIEAITSAQALSDQLQCSRPGSWINCGGTGIGWSNGAALGVRLGMTELAQNGSSSSRLVCQVVGDGSLMCAAPSTAFWVASKYKIPVLTIVLNNGGWKAPRDSARIVYPNGLNASATDDEANTSLRPTPNYAALAEAAAGSEEGWNNVMSEDGKSPRWMKGLRVKTVSELTKALELAKIRLVQEEKGMLIEALM